MNRRLNRRGVHQLFLLCWVMYFCSYLGRLNYSSVMSELIGSALTKSQAGWISTAFLIAYASGQLINGILSEKFSPRALGAIGALGGGALNVAFCFLNTFGGMLVCRLLTGLCMSMLWPAMLQMMVVWMNENDKESCAVNIASAMASGTLGSYALSAALLKWVSWQSAFWVPGALLTALGLLWWLLLPHILENAVEPAQVCASEPAAASGEQLPIRKLLCVPMLLAAVVPVILHGAIKDGVTAWVPTYVVEVFNRSASFSSLVSTLLPLVNLAGAYMGRAVYRKMKRNTLCASAVFFCIAAVMLAAMLTVARESLVLTMICFAVITSAMMAVNTLLVSLLPLYFSRYGRASTVAGTLNAVAYGGSALASGMIGVLSSAYGWNAAIVSWLVMMAVGAAVCTVFRRTADT